jgi:hypothetical protein
MRSIAAPFVAIVLALLVSPAFSDVPRLLITPSGFFLLDIDQDGNPTTRQIDPSRVIDLRGGDTTTPPAPPAPDPPTSSPDEGLSAKVNGWSTEEADPGGAAALAMVYGQVGEAVRAGHVPPLSAPEIVAQATDKLVAEKWSKFRLAIGNEASDRLRRGDLTAAEPMADFLLAISLGLEKGAEQIDLARAVAITDTINQAITATQ